MTDVNAIPDELPKAPLSLDTPQADLAPSLREDAVNPVLALLLNALLGWHLALVFFRVALKYFAGIDGLVPAANESAHPGFTAQALAKLGAAFVAATNPTQGADYAPPVFWLLSALGGLATFALALALLRKADLGQSLHLVLGLTLIAAILGPALLGLGALWLMIAVGIAAMFAAKQRYAKA